MEIDEIKLFLRIDHNEEEDLISSLQLSAETYLNNCGIAKDDSNELYKLAVKLLIGHWYENRDIVGKADKLAFSLESIINQLRYSV